MWFVRMLRTRCNRFGLMKQLIAILLSLGITYCSAGQNDDKLIGTWVHFKVKVDHKKLVGDNVNISPDTIFITNDTFEKRVWMENEEPFIQTGLMTTKEDKIIVTKRVTSISDPHGQPPDIYYRFKLKNKILIIGNAVRCDNEIEDNSIKLYYRKIEIK